MNRKCLIYYHNDLDGKCSAAITEKMLNSFNEIELFAVEQKQEIIVPEEDFHFVYVLDFYFNEAKINEFISKCGKNNFVCIDHHQTTKNEIGYLDIKGVIDPKAKGACLLVWDYFHPKVQPPIPVEWIADRDTWVFDYGDDTKNFCEYMNYENTNPLASIWDDLLSIISITNFYLQEILKKGSIIRKAKMINLESVSNNCYEGMILGYKCLFINYNDRNSNSDLLNLMLKKGYDLAIAWFVKKRDGKLRYIFSVRSTEKVNSRKIAENFHGGGHDIAAGFSSKKWPEEIFIL
jgi:oligoribonuclease NrnB/cAMP/cGMP phosphodiesterase (DHH superfamily)